MSKYARFHEFGVSHARWSGGPVIKQNWPRDLGGFNCAGRYNLGDHSVLVTDEDLAADCLAYPYEPRPFLSRALADVDFAQAERSIYAHMADAIRDKWDNTRYMEDLGFVGLPSVTVDRRTGMSYERNAEGRIVSMTTTVAIVGARFHKGAAEALAEMDKLLAKESISFQQGLELRREPDNPHDKNAVAVWVRYRKGGKTHEQHLGYVPREDAKGVAKVMDERIRIKVTYKGKAEMTLWWPASTQEDLEREYRRAMSIGEGL